MGKWCYISTTSVFYTLDLDPNVNSLGSTNFPQLDLSDLVLEPNVNLP